MTIFIRTALLASIVFGFPACAAAQADTVWSELYVKDLEMVRGVIASDHPGSVDPRNPEFRRTLASAYSEALDAAKIVNNYETFRIALARFGNRFQDAHLGVGPRQSRPLQGVKDAGIYPVYRNDAFIVASVDERYGERAREIRDATLLSCDGKPIANHFREGILSWRGRASIVADWYRWAPYTLLDYGPPTAAAPRRCRFQSPDGNRRMDVPLLWDSVKADRLEETVRQSSGFAVHPLGVSVSDDRKEIWLDLPTFAVDGDSVPRMRATIDSLASMLRRNSDWKLLVIDLRGNNGGSSVWGAEISAAIFGEERTKEARQWLGDGSYTEYRVSRRNLEALEGQLKQTVDRHGATSGEAAQMRAFMDSMNAAYSRGDSLYGARRSRRGVPRPTPRKVSGKIVVVTSSSCFSACLDFMDLMKLHPAVVQVGQPTGVDTDYMENWGWTAPSGMIQIGYPMKVYRNRRRRNNESYPPSVRRDSIADTESLRQWIRANYRKW